MYVYKVTNKINNKIYIGKTIQDISKSENYYGSGLIIINAIKKYGINNFEKEILFQTDLLEELNEKEKFFISYYKSTDRKIGYNITNGGDGGDMVSNHPEKEKIKVKKLNSIEKFWTKEEREKISKKYTGEKNPFFNKTHTEETKKKISEKNKNKIISKEVSKRISETLKRKYKNGELTKVVSEETKKKLSEKHIGLKHTEETKNKISESIKGEKNPSAKCWLFINKNGLEIIINGGFKKFCIEYNLSYKAMRNISENKRKNKYYNSWTVKRINYENNKT